MSAHTFITDTMRASLGCNAAADTYVYVIYIFCTILLIIVVVVIVGKKTRVQTKFKMNQASTY